MLKKLYRLNQYDYPRSFSSVLEIELSSCSEGQLERIEERQKAVEKILMFLTSIMSEEQKDALMLYLGFDPFLEETKEPEAIEGDEDLLIIRRSHPPERKQIRTTKKEKYRK